MTENTQRKNIQPLFPNGYRGLADSRWSGVQGSVAEAVGIDAHSQPGTLKVHQKLSLDSGGVIDERCDNVVNVSDGSRLWFSSESGKIWREVDGTYTLIADIELEDYSPETLSGTDKNIVRTDGDNWGSRNFPNFFIGNNGTRAYIANNDLIYQETISTAYDLSTTGTTGSTSFKHTAQTDDSVGGLQFSSDGTKMYITTTNSGPRVLQYNLSTAWSITTASFNQAFSLTSQISSSATSITFSEDGTKMYINRMFTNSGHVFRYDLSTAWDISTASYVHTVELYPIINTVEVLRSNAASWTINISPDGTRLFMITQTYFKEEDEAPEGGLFEFELTTPFDLTTATYNGRYRSTRPVTFTRGTFPTVLQPRDFQINWDRKEFYFGHEGNINVDGTLYRTGLYVFDAEGEPGIKWFGASEFQEDIYFASAKTLFEMPLSSLSAGTFSIKGSFNNEYEGHPMVVQNLQLYIGDGNKIAAVDVVGNFFPESGFEVEEGENILTLAPFDIDILVGTEYKQNKGRILRWDTFADSWSAEDIVYEQGVRAFIHDDNFIYAYCGKQGQLYFYNGERLEKMNRIRGDWQGNQAEVKHGSVAFWKGLPVFALSTVTGTPCKMGAYSFGSYGPGYPKIMDLAFPIGETYNNIEFGGVVADGADLYVSTSAGVFKLDYTAKYEHAHIETMQLTDGTDRSLYNTKTKYHVNYVSLPENTNIGIAYRGKYADSFTTMTTGVVNDTKHERIDAKLSVPNITSLQLRFDMTVDGNNAPEIENINII